MTCQEIETRLDEFVDGELGDAEREAVAAHLAACVPCRRLAEATQSIVTAAASLPRAIEPGRDLFPAILGDIQGFPGRQRAQGPRSGRAGLWYAAAASVAAVLLLAAVARWLGQASSTAPAAARSTTPEALPARDGAPDDLALALEEYAAASKLLLSALAERRDRLPPETRAVLDENLAVVDRAIAQTQAALAATPSNRSNVWLLATLEQQKLDFLRRVFRLASL